MTITTYDSVSLAALGTILGVWAHPDDETYLCGGLFAAAAAAGARVACVTATRGEAGSVDHDRWPPATLAGVRTKELEVALGTLGVTEHYWLDYPDGGCADVPAVEAVSRLAEIIEDVQPDTILTFGPDGMTGHADHIAICEWATMAVAGTGTRAALHYATVTPDQWADMAESFFTLGISMGGQPDETQPDECSLYVVLPDQLKAVKDRAVRAQVSQTETLIDTVGAAAFESFIAIETFKLAARQA